MTIGTKSVLFGAHQFIIHPIILAIAWTRLYGFPWDPRLWVAFFVHDLGYIGKPNIDGEEGEQHPELGARIMQRLFGRTWYDFTVCHSRFYAKKLGKPMSKLCVADKLAVALTPSVLYVPFIRLSGEWKEFRAESVKVYEGTGKYYDRHPLDSPWEWFRSVKKHRREWAYVHRDQITDTWMPECRQ